MATLELRFNALAESQIVAEQLARLPSACAPEIASALRQAADSAYVAAYGRGGGVRPSHLIIGCGKRKATEPRPARDLYTGSLFTAARRYAEAAFLPWRILSAKHGLVDPDQVLEPYDVELTGPYWGKPELRACVGLQLAQLGWSGLLEVHAGHEYAELVRVEAAYSAPGLRVVSPVAGLQVGQRLAWYRAERERRATS